MHDVDPARNLLCVAALGRYVHRVDEEGVGMGELQGVDLVRAVIEKVRASSLADVFGIEHVGHDHQAVPVAAKVLDSVRLDGGVPLSPCLKAWLAFDGSWFGWIVRGEIRGKPLGRLAEDTLAHVGLMFETFESVLPLQCYLLPFGNMEVKHAVYPGEPDAIGELPILSIDSENQTVGIAYPGIDMLLGERAGLLDRTWRGSVRNRLKEHQQKTFGGRQALELGDEGFDEEPKPDPGQPATLTKMGTNQYALVGDGPVPEGYVVVQEAQNPFTKERMRMLAKA